LPKIIEFCLRIQIATSKNASWPHFSWPTLYFRTAVQLNFTED